MGVMNMRYTGETIRFQHVAVLVIPATRRVILYFYL